MSQIPTYSPTVWKDKTDPSFDPSADPPINAANLNKIEQGILGAHQGLQQHTTAADPHPQYLTRSDAAATYLRADEPLYVSDLADVDLLGLADGMVLRYNAQTGRWQPAEVAAGGGTGGGGGDLTLYFPDAPPATPGPRDDEFDDQDLGAQWSVYDFGSVLSVDEDEQGLLLTHAGASGDRLAGVYRDLPEGDFTVTVKLSFVGKKPFAGSYAAGLALFSDPTAPGASVSFFGLSSGSLENLRVRVLGYYGYNSQGSNAVDTNWQRLGGSAYLRLRRVGAEVAFDVSEDGVSWVNHYQGAALSGFGKVGLVLNCTNPTYAGPVSVWVRFWRESAGSAFGLPVAGRAVQLGGGSGGEVGGGGSSGVPRVYAGPAFPAAAEPSPAEGDLFLHTVEHQLWRFEGGQWRLLTTFLTPVTKTPQPYDRFSREAVAVLAQNDDLGRPYRGSDPTGALRIVDGQVHLGTGPGAYGQRSFVRGPVAARRGNLLRAIISNRNSQAPEPLAIGFFRQAVQDLANPDTYSALRLDAAGSAGSVLVNRHGAEVYAGLRSEDIGLLGVDTGEGAVVWYIDHEPDRYHNWGYGLTPVALEEAPVGGEYYAGVQVRDGADHSLRLLEVDHRPLPWYALATLADRFSGVGYGLGRAETGQTWQVRALSGEAIAPQVVREPYGITSDRSAMVLGEADGGVALLHARIHVGAEVGECGLVFRCADTRNYWMANFNDTGVHVYRVVGGAEDHVVSSGLGALTPNTTRWVQILNQADRIAVLVDGQQVALVVRPSDPQETDYLDDGYLSHAPFAGVRFWGDNRGKCWVGMFAAHTALDKQPWAFPIDLTHVGIRSSNAAEDNFAGALSPLSNRMLSWPGNSTYEWNGAWQLKYGAGQAMAGNYRVQLGGLSEDECYAIPWYGCGPVLISFTLRTPYRDEGIPQQVSSVGVFFANAQGEGTVFRTLVTHDQPGSSEVEIQRMVGWQATEVLEYINVGKHLEFTPQGNSVLYEYVVDVYFDGAEYAVWVFGRVMASGSLRKGARLGEIPQMPEHVGIYLPALDSGSQLVSVSFANAWRQEDSSAAS